MFICIVLLDLIIQFALVLFVFYGYLLGFFGPWEGLVHNISLSNRWTVADILVIFEI